MMQIVQYHLLLSGYCTEHMTVWAVTSADHPISMFETELVLSDQIFLFYPPNSSFFVIAACAKIEAIGAESHSAHRVSMFIIRNFHSSFQTPQANTFVRTAGYKILAVWTEPGSVHQVFHAMSSPLPYIAVREAIDFLNLLKFFLLAFGLLQLCQCLGFLLGLLRFSFF